MGCVLTQKDQLDALDARKQKMVKEGALYRSYALLKYAILNKSARLNSTSDTLQKFIGGCMNTQKLQKPHKTEKACDKAGNCEWVNTIPQIEEKIDEAFPDDKEKAECEKERVRKFKTYKKFGIFPITSDELQEHLTSARVLWLKKHLSKTTTRGMDGQEPLQRQQCAKCNGEGTRMQDGKQVKCPKMADGNFLGWWPATNDTKYNIGYDPTVEELQELATELSMTCGRCKHLEGYVVDETAAGFKQAFIKQIVEHHDGDHRHVMNEAGRPRGDSNASDSSNNTQGSTSQSGSATPSRPYEGMDCEAMSAEGETPEAARSPAVRATVKRRRLADAAFMGKKDVDTMSPSQLALHRRRLAHGVRTPPVLAALMKQIEEAERKHRLRR